MRLDARKGDHFWRVWHVEECCVVKLCVWVDDETHRYGVRHSPITIIDRRELLIDEFQARKIVIYGSRRLVLINPADDDIEATVDTVEEVAV
jgi:hypothetical protein